MKKKIAGVLTTVLAASLLVGGNHPVTVQVDNMISGTQDDEDTPRHRRKKKRQKKKHRKGKQPRTAPTVLPQTKKHFSKKPKNWHSSMIIPARSPC